VPLAYRRGMIQRLSELVSSHTREQKGKRMKITIPEKTIDIKHCNECPHHACYIDSDGCADCSCRLSVLVDKVEIHNNGIPEKCPLKVR
jgi:hypothetical protein